MGESRDEGGDALGLGFRRVAKSSPLIPSPSKETAVAADGEGVSAAADDRGDGVRLEGFDAARPLLLLPIPHPQLPIFPRTPARNKERKLVLLLMIVAPVSSALYRTARMRSVCYHARTMRSVRKERWLRPPSAF